MLPDLMGMGCYFGYLLAVGLPVILLKVFVKLPFEITRKLYHLLITLSIFPLVKCFTTWYMAVLTVFLLAALAYPVLVLGEKAAWFQRIAVERKGGEFRSSLLIVQGAMALLLFVFWGLLGESWKFIAVVAVLAWGLGDAAAALVGKSLGRRRIQHPRIQGTKTYEGTFAMYLTAGLAIFFTLLLEADQSWVVSLTAAALVAPVCALVELFSSRGMDTLSVPLSAAFAMLPLMSLFAYLRI